MAAGAAAARLVAGCRAPVAATARPRSRWRREASEFGVERSGLVRE
ncbi:hypothetical protein C7S17_6975 [Burkholderia thailandensis]|nr:hypothetical protein [Burkholderia thailandensis]